MIIDNRSIRSGNYHTLTIVTPVAQGAAPTDYAELEQASAVVNAVSNVDVLESATMTRPGTGAYVKVSGSGIVRVATSGWVYENATQNVVADDMYYPLKNATFIINGRDVESFTEGYVPGSTVIATIRTGIQTISGGNITLNSSSTALASNGLSNGSTKDASKKVALISTEQAGTYELETSGYANITREAVNRKVTTSGYFQTDVMPIEVIAPTAEYVYNDHDHYYIAQSTLSSNEIYFNASDQTITVGEGYYHEPRTITVHGIPEQTPAFAGGAVTGAGTINATNGVSLGSSDVSGVSITVGGNAARGAVTYNGAVSGYVDKTDGAEAMSAGQATSLDTNTYYIQGIELTVPESGVRNFSITVPNGDSTVTFIYTIDSEGNVVIS